VTQVTITVQDIANRFVFIDSYSPRLLSGFTYRAFSELKGMGAREK